jgi:hypothetical protein
MLEINYGDTCNSHFADDGSLSEDFSQKHRIMCRNGKRIPLTAIPHDDCALTVVTGGEVSCLL